MSCDDSRGTSRSLPIDRITAEGGSLVNLMQVAQHADDLTPAQLFYTRLLGREPAGVFSPGCCSTD